MFSKKKTNDTENPITENTAEEQLNKELTDDANADTITEPVEEISAEEQLKLDNAALNDKYLRLFAEFDNFKRRTQKERVELLQTAGKDVIISMLPVLDDFDRANKATENATDVAAIREGIQLVHTKLKSILSQKGLKEMECANTVFDTDLHEAITKVPAPTEELKGKVIDELEKGYTLNDKVIRFAKVVVGS
ncbi:molecular chaperone GrpE [Pedobacter cryoconitis]|uniref:Protein GrpE n=1 Tax=Pedobacter cryoconitis TaxID=188932 RepID=A0A7W8YX09_9SPHI|nr:nucleotide exchange factor GrpE [Pedobacter cryoconitis]MBB5623367.1 molecular chaperone GrpE [Pedobacter cryoconitis]MBB5646649.1 molecular chaperone GrpE [Pedobacter cryoconitis]